MTVDQEFVEKARRLAWAVKLGYRRSRLADRKPWKVKSFDFRKLAGDEGWVYLSSGHFSRVYAHLEFPDYVVKVSGPAHFGELSRGIPQRRARQDAWPTYAEYCRDNPHKHLPEILHFERMSMSFAWGIMPRYYKAPPTKSGRVASRWHAYLNEEEPAPEWLWPIIGMCRSLNMQIDLHDENVMLDKNGIMKLTDPFSGYEDDDLY
jgi:hypothetical protein